MTMPLLNYHDARYSIPERLRCTQNLICREEPMKSSKSQTAAEEKAKGRPKRKTDAATARVNFPKADAQSAAAVASPCVAPKVRYCRPAFCSLLNRHLCKSVTGSLLYQESTLSGIHLQLCMSSRRCYYFTLTHKLILLVLSKKKYLYLNIIYLTGEGAANEAITLP